MTALLVPLGLIILHAVSVPMLLQGRKAILLGNWFRHRNFMLINGALFALIMALTVLLLYFIYASGNVAGPVAWAVWVLLAPHLAGLAALMVMLPWTLYRVARHLLLPHKLMARQTIKVWLFVAGSGIVFSGFVLLSGLTT